MCAVVPMEGGRDPRKEWKANGDLLFVMVVWREWCEIGPIIPTAMINTLLLLFAFHQPFMSTASAPVLTGGNDVAVVVHIKGLDDAMYGRLAKVIASEPSASLEYGCVWSGIVVFKFNDTAFAERADVVSHVSRIMDDARISAPVEVLHVHMEARGPGKC